MQIISTNIAKPTTIIWRGNEVTTGIYKKPVNQPLYLNKEEVKGDEVSDRRFHGGINKACYLFSVDHYAYWQNLYPNLDWEYGMFGENLTVKGLDETQIHIGDIYKLGTALVQVTQPREPCYKFGVKFESQQVLPQFVSYGYSGVYVKVLKEGEVNVNDTISLVEKAKNSLSIFNLFKLIFAREKDQNHLAIAINNEVVPNSLKVALANFIKQ
ncbi:MOSC domain-containing protein [Flavobacteriaceae bacterium AU392]|nr:MOSC domain-containing protein [Flavobacteriaceae bacterium]RKM81119.1 MOSC domain-containing protein [Flavobacteriaceae bacterium AU392]